MSETGRTQALLLALALTAVAAALLHPLVGGVLFRRDLHLLWQPNHDAFARALAAGASRCGTTRSASDDPSSPTPSPSSSTRPTG